ncbi:MAG: redoxin domain-containing protein, partial [Planctomycetota bacterium]|nr:redoxin domain-containing protein [Planctomycetota bacterium]
IAMKRCLISITIVLAVLLTAWAVFGQEAGKETPAGAGARVRRPADVNRPAGQRVFEGLSPEERAKMKEKFNQMSEEEKEKFRAQMREKFGAGRAFLGREEQLKVVAAIEEQIAKLKAVIEAQPGPEEFAKMRELPEEERTKLREKFARANEERQKAIEAIEQHIAKLKGERQRIEEQQKLIGELQAIRDLAVQEKAGETAKRIEQLIDRRRKEFEGKFPGLPERPERITRREGAEEAETGRESPVTAPSTAATIGAEKADAGRKAPEFTLNNFDGKKVMLSDNKGKIVVLEWFNFECPYVMGHYGERKTMVELANKYKDKNVVWLAVNSTNYVTPQKNKEFATQHKLPYPILDDRAGTVGRAYGAQTTPHIFIIDTRGNIVYNGAIDNAPLGKTTEGEAYVNYVDKALAELTEGKAVTTANTKPYGCTVKYPR